MSLLLQFLFHGVILVILVFLLLQVWLVVRFCTPTPGKSGQTKVLREHIVKQSVEDQKAKDLHDRF